MLLIGSAAALIAYHLGMIGAQRRVSITQKSRHCGTRIENMSHLNIAEGKAACRPLVPRPSVAGGACRLHAASSDFVTS